MSVKASSGEVVINRNVVRSGFVTFRYLCNSENKLTDQNISVVRLVDYSPHVPALSLSNILLPNLSKVFKSDPVTLHLSPIYNLDFSTLCSPQVFDVNHFVT